MPWHEVSVMDQRAEFVRLALLEGANRRELCRRFGIHPDTGYKWLRRRAAGETELSDHSRRPHRSPNQTDAALEAKVLALRDVHPAWGARKLVACLRRENIVPPTASTVHAMLRRNDRVIETAGQGAPLTRFEKAAPNLLWQMDFKGWVKLSNGTRCHPLSVVDDHSRYLVNLTACANQTETTVRGHLETAFRRHGLPEAMFVDNGSPWGGGPGERWTRFGVWLLKLGVRVLHSRPYHPQSRGKNERFHRTLNKEVLSLACFRGLNEAQRAFDAWLPIYNGERPHEALGMAVPADRYRASPRPMPARLMEPTYDEGDIVRKVGTTKAYIQFKGRAWPVGQAFFGERVAIRPRGSDGHYGIFYGAHRIGEIDLAMK
jgi:transposase InsO family protein